MQGTHLQIAYGNEEVLTSFCMHPGDGFVAKQVPACLNVLLSLTVVYLYFVVWIKYLKDTTCLLENVSVHAIKEYGDNTDSSIHS